MFAFALALFLALVAAAAVLAAEAGTGRLVGRTAGRTRARAVVFFAASAAGGALLVALGPEEWPMTLALFPITALSVVRFAMLAHGWWRGWRHVVLTAVVVLLGVLACLPWLPRPLNRDVLLNGLRGQPTRYPDSISPEASFPVRA